MDDHQEFSITSQPVPKNAALLTLSGRQEDADFDRLNKEFHAMLEAGVAGIVLDARELTGFTSAGLGLVIDVTKTLAVRNGKLLLAGLSPEMDETLGLLGVKGALEFVATPDQGKKAVYSL